MQELRSYVTPWRASSSYRFHVHTFCHACTRMTSRSSPRLQHPILSKKTLEIKNVLASAPIFKKSWSLWTKARLASSLLEQTLKNTFGEGPSNRSAIFVKPQRLNPKKLGGKHGQKPQHNPKGNYTAEWRASSCPAQKKKKLPLLDHTCKNFLFLSTYSSFCR
jgi:hypothetical protein